QTVFAATTAGVYKSTDAGATWSQVLNVPVCMDLALLANDTSVLMCGAGNMNTANKGLYRSADGGLSWSIVPGIPNPAHTGRTSIALYPDDNHIAIVQVCDAYNTIGFYKTTNGGITWTTTSSQDIGSYQGWYCAGMIIRAGDPNEILVGGVNMHRSTDGGFSFSQVSDMSWGPQYMHSDVHSVVVNPQNPSSAFIATDGGLFRSYDFGDSYIECVDGYVTSQCYIGSVSQTNPDFALTGLQDNYSIRYDGNPYWTPVVGGDGCYNAIDPIDDFVSYVAYQYLNIFQSFDQGITYSQVNFESSSPSLPNPTAFLAPYIICPSDNARLYAGRTGVARSDNQGGTWPTVSADPIDNGNYVLTIAVSSLNSDSVYIATAPDNSPSKLMLSADAGQTFMDRSAGLPDRFPRRIAVDPRNSKIVYVVYAGFGTGHVFKSIDAGANWTNIGTTLPDVPFHCVMLDPQFPDIVYVGTDMGIFVTNDGGASWSAHNTGLYDWTMVYDLVPCASDRSFLCFTHGHGAFKRSLNDVIGISDQAAPTPFSLSVFPNPVNDVATLVLGESFGPVELNVYDLQGKIIFTKAMTVDPASPYVRLDVSEWANGCYIAEAVDGKRKATTRILVAR
ncbi:MAG: T9SS type A sorting domain-containing protein, partial [Bacteroidota bacterium]|nr:T9SS type A sorting domain-containing protein [Bacteroidota bacterium]